MTIIRPAETGMSAALEKAADTLRKGGLIAYPTETFYGLGVRFDDRRALEKLYRIKKRSRQKALPLIIGERRILELIVSVISNPAEILIKNFWPGPLTLLLPAKPGLSDLITAQTGNVAVRIPGASFALELARSLEFPITATSANVSGMLPADTAKDVIGYFREDLDIIIDYGRAPGGRPSTIVDASGEKIRFLRTGAISQEEVTALL